ncbi:uncharacterized protein LOC133844517 isoform X2 [Drosophila sulfurigaster albostrigata]|uniref:uncharacterized protein LOC133844517 isoform X2 n=1 Tax=Drosophila sulfurigaster albostrigata TaxID=89887 RepID=UPI002D21BFF9|nr:uncharacterized protein LOC133844517 isoform X2 [Drosophila sulfurigaster albostrigata]
MRAMQLLQLALCLPLLLVLLIFIQSSHSTSSQNPNHADLSFINATKEIVSFVQLDIKDLDKETGDFNAKRVREYQLKVIQHFKNVSAQVRQIEKLYLTTLEKSLYNRLMNERCIFVGLHAITEHFKYMDGIDEIEEDTLLIFTETVSQRIFNPFLTRPIDWFYLPLHGLKCNKYDETCQKFNWKLEDLSMIYEIPMNIRCQLRQSPQHIIYSIYKEIALFQLTAYILIEYSMMIQRVSGNGNFITKRNSVRQNYNEITKKALTTLKEVTEKADRLLWRCEPSPHIHNVTYDEVTRLLQGYIENEVDLNTDATCSRTCADYHNATSKSCSDNKFCAQQPKCSGRIHDCQFIDSVLSVCQSPENSTRRYEYIEYGESKSLGKNEKCWRDFNKVKSWKKFLSIDCSYCFCLCDEQSPKSDRYFNLRETLSDVNANKVVTGVRFVKKNRIFHLQIQQGELLPRGLINESTVEWKPVDNYEIGDSNAKEGVDYHTLTYQNRAIDLDEVTKPDDTTFVVTGVRFQVLDGHLNLKVHFSQLDFVKGKLIDPEVNSIWQSNDNDNNRKQNLPTREYWTMLHKGQFR